MASWENNIYSPRQKFHRIYEEPQGSLQFSQQPAHVPTLSHISQFYLSYRTFKTPV